MIKANETGVCPHCNIANRFEIARDMWKSEVKPINLFTELTNHSQNVIRFCKCTNCLEVIIFFNDTLICPSERKIERQFAPAEVPKEIKQDFDEACLVEPISNKAAAALAR